MMSDEWFIDAENNQTSDESVSSSNAPKWLDDCVNEGLQKLVLLRLKNSPPAEVILNVLDVWLDAFMSRESDWAEARDLPRVEHAFRYVIARFDSWPAPVQVYDLMPPKPKVPELLPPRPKRNFLKAEQSMAKMNALFATWTTKPPKRSTSVEQVNKAFKHSKQRE